MTDFADGAGRPGADRALSTSRLIHAPPKRVFAAFSDPTLLAKWWGPSGFTNTFETFDLRPGGRWRFVMHGPDGKDYRNESVFVSVDPPERVVFRHVSGHRFEMTITFDAKGEETVVGWRQLFETAAERDRVATFALAANEENLDRLEAVLRQAALEAGA